MRVNINYKGLPVGKGEQKYGKQHVVRTLALMTIRTVVKIMKRDYNGNGWICYILLLCT